MQATCYSYCSFNHSACCGYYSFNPKLFSKFITFQEKVIITKWILRDHLFLPKVTIVGPYLFDIYESVIGVFWAHSVYIAWCLARYLKSTLGNIRLICSCMSRNDEAQADITREKKVSWSVAKLKSVHFPSNHNFLIFVCIKKVQYALWHIIW